MGTLVSLLVSMLGQLVPLIGTNSALITNIVNGLIEIVPLISQEIQDVIPPIKNIIATLQANPATDAVQLATLQALDLQVDTAFDTAAAAAQSQDAAAAGTSGT